MSTNTRAIIDTTNNQIKADATKAEKYRILEKGCRAKPIYCMTLDGRIWVRHLTKTFSIYRWGDWVQFDTLRSNQRRNSMKDISVDEFKSFEIRKRLASCVFTTFECDKSVKALIVVINIHTKKVIFRVEDLNDSTKTEDYTSLEDAIQKYNQLR